MNPTMQWYATLVKPFWAPPAYLFGPVWTVLYILIVISFGFVFRLAWNKKSYRKLVLPFFLNLIFNVLFTPIQFGLRNNWLALLDILLVLGTLIWAMRVIYKKQPYIAYAQIPYLLWVSFATILQITITFLNF
ncbi:MAG: TspO/MBR family protein [Candidatus Shapirobacteria bacterium]